MALIIAESNGSGLDGWAYDFAEYLVGKDGTGVENPVDISEWWVVNAGKGGVGTFLKSLINTYVNPRFLIFAILFALTVAVAIAVVRLLKPFVSRWMERLPIRCGERASAVNDGGKPKGNVLVDFCVFFLVAFTGVSMLTSAMLHRMPLARLLSLKSGIEVEHCNEDMLPFNTSNEVSCIARDNDNQLSDITVKVIDGQAYLYDENGNLMKVKQ